MSIFFPFRADRHLTTRTVLRASSRLLLGVVLNDELLLNWHVDLLTYRKLVHEDPHPVRKRLDPGGDDPLAVGLTSHDERGHLDRLGTHVDDILRRHLERRNIHFTPVDVEVPVRHQLPGVPAGPGEPGAVDHVVEAALEQLQQVVTGLAGTTARLVVVAAELLLEHAIGVPGLLLLLQLLAVLALLHPATAVLARRVRAALESAIATDQVDSQPARLLRHGSGVTGHWTGYSLLLASDGIRPGAAWVGGSRCGPKG